MNRITQSLGQSAVAGWGHRCNCVEECVLHWVAMTARLDGRQMHREPPLILEPEMQDWLNVKPTGLLALNAALIALLKVSIYAYTTTDHQGVGF